MILNEALIFLITFLAAGILGYYIIYRFHVEGVKRFQLLISYFGALSVLLISYNIYKSLQSNMLIEKNRIAYNTIANIETNFLHPQKELLKQFPEGFFLYASMNQDTDLSAHEPKEFNKSKRAQLEVCYSIRVFQTMEDFLSTCAYDITGIYVWINNFLMWLQSPILRHNWNILGFNFADDTRELVGRLIKKSDELIELRKKKGHLTFQDYDAISKNFSVTPR